MSMKTMPAVIVALSVLTAIQPLTVTTASAKTGNQDYDEVVAKNISGATPKIVGGQLAPDKAFPWQASLQVAMYLNPASSHFCGGTVYATRWIVTAAHCVTNLQPSQIVVSTGVNMLGPGARRIKVTRLIAHPQYAGATHDYDIALIELATPLVFDDRTKAATLISAQDDAALQPGSPLTVTGWGATQMGGGIVRELRYVDVDFVDLTTCNKPFSYNGKITGNMLCAGPADGGQDSCQGDSGGPLVLKGTSQLAGVVSWGEGCAQKLKFGVYTRVSPFAGWIVANAR
jgi:secreted trypsin-like serine protease